MRWYVAKDKTTSLMHYGVKGMKWGVVNEKDEVDTNIPNFHNKSSSNPGLGYNTSSNRSTPTSKITISKDAATKTLYNITDNYEQIVKDNGPTREVYNTVSVKERADIVRAFANNLSSEDLQNLIKEADDIWKKGIADRGNEGYVATDGVFSTPNDYAHIVLGLIDKYFK